MFLFRGELRVFQYYCIGISAVLVCLNRPKKLHYVKIIHRSLVYQLSVNEFLDYNEPREVMVDFLIERLPVEYDGNEIIGSSMLSYQVNHAYNYRMVKVPIEDQE